MHGAPNLFGSIGTAAAGVDADNHCLDVVVLHEFVEVVHYLRTNYLTAGRECPFFSRTDDVAVGIVHSHFSVARSGFCNSRHFCGFNEVEVRSSGQRAQLFAHLVHIGRFVGQFHFYVICGIGQRDVFVGDGVETIGTDFSRCADIFADVAPNVADERCHLLAVGIAHFRKCERFHKALIRAHAEGLHLHAYLVEQVFVEDRLRGKSFPVNHARRVHYQFVGSRSHVVGTLRVGVAIGKDKLARLLEVDDGFAQFLQRGEVGRENAAFYIYSGNFPVVFCLLHGSEHFVEPLRAGGSIAEKHVERIFFGSLHDVSAKLKVEHSAVGDGGFCVLRSNHRKHHDDAHEACENAHHH